MHIQKEAKGHYENSITELSTENANGFTESSRVSRKEIYALQQIENFLGKSTSRHVQI